MHSSEKNRDTVIGIVFLKFGGDKFEVCRAKIVEEYGNVPAFLEWGIDSLKEPESPAILRDGFLWRCVANRVLAYL